MSTSKVVRHVFSLRCASLLGILKKKNESILIGAGLNVANGYTLFLEYLMYKVKHER